MYSVNMKDLCIEGNVSKYNGNVLVIFCKDIIFFSTDVFLQ